MPYTPMNERKQYDGFGRIGLDDDAPDTEIANIKNPTALTGSVGEGGQNDRRDVAKVETMLGVAGALEHILSDIAPYEIEEFIRRMKSDKK